MNGPPEHPRRLLLLIFISSLSCLAYEIALIRIFSITLWYHFAFMVISIAMLGIGASGTLLTVVPALKDLRRVTAYGLFLAVSIPASYLIANMLPFDPARLSWDTLQVLYIGLYYLVLAVPFVFFGLIVSTALSSIRTFPGSIYASDLLGAGTGSLLMFCLLFLGGPEQVVFILSSLAAAGLLVCAHGWIRISAGILIAVNVFILLLQPPFIQTRMSPYKPLEVALRFPGAERLNTFFSPYSRLDLFKSPAVRYAPGLSLTYLDPLPDQTGLAIDGGDIHAVTDDTSAERLSFLAYLPSGIPYLLGRNSSVLILEPKGGLAALLPKHYGAARIIAVDSNPLVMRAVRELRPGASFFSDGVELHRGLGRAWLSSSTGTFDVIDLSFMGHAPSSSFGFAEDYRFTVEAFKIYLDHLEPEGILSLNLYIIPPPRTEFRFLVTLAEAAEKAGIRDIRPHLAVLRSWGTLTMLFRKTPLSHEDVRRIQAFCRERRFDTVYYPGITPDAGNLYVKMPGNEYFEAVQRLIDPATRKQFMHQSLFDIRPVHDDGPFVHYFLKFGNIREIYRVMGEKWQYFIEEGYLLPALFAQVMVISVMLILLPLFTRNRSGPANVTTGTLASLSYFAAIGLGFLFVEIVIIQKMVLVLEHPAYAAGTVIASVLAGSGTGSFASQHRAWLRKPRSLLGVAVLCVCYILALPAIGAPLGSLMLPLRIAAVFLLFLPLGFFMGIPLPLGIAGLQKNAPDLVPWAWAVNGCFSVLSPILAVMLALSKGFDAVILCGAGLYVAGFLLINPFRGGRRSPLSNQ